MAGQAPKGAHPDVHTTRPGRSMPSPMSSVRLKQVAGDVRHLSPSVPVIRRSSVHLFKNDVILVL